MIFVPFIDHKLGAFLRIGLSHIKLAWHFGSWIPLWNFLIDLLAFSLFFVLFCMLGACG